VGVIRIEPEDPVKENQCSTCAGTNRLMHGYVYEDDNAHGVYFLEWCDGGHTHKAAFLTIGLGTFISPLQRGAIRDADIITGCVPSAGWLWPGSWQLSPAGVAQLRIA
jgi:hypothetical protein